MRTLGFLLLIVGAALAVQGHAWLPAPLQLGHWVQLPTLPVSLLVIGLGLGALGLVLAVIPRRSGPEHTDAVIRAELEHRGFLITADVGGWRADGEWDGNKALIRRVSGYEAARFGRPWIIEVSLCGVPREPWPLHPDEGKVVDRRDHGFSVTIPALGRPTDRDRVAHLISAVVACAI
jgi:hypothetical protein